MTGRDPDAVQLRAVAPLVDASGALLGPVTLVTNGTRTIGITSSEILRPCDPTSLAIVSLDGQTRTRVANWYLGRYAGVGLVELGEAIASADITPLAIGAICATADTRGAPSALVTIVTATAGFTREIVAVHVDANDGGGMSDDVVHLASPIEIRHLDAAIHGAALFSWFPPDPVLGRKGEVLAVGVAYPYVQNLAKPRDLPPIAQILGLEDLGRALIGKASAPEQRPELHSVTGEIVDARGDVDRAVLDPVEEIRRQREPES